MNKEVISDVLSSTILFSYFSEKPILQPLLKTDGLHTTKLTTLGTYRVRKTAKEK